MVDGDEPSKSGKDVSSLIKWNISTIPVGSQIRSASVTLNVTNASIDTFRAYQLKRPWVELETTWLAYANSKSWEIAGATGPLDRASEAAGTITPSAKGKQTFNLSPALVQSWVDDPANNFGIIIADTTNKDGFDFTSRESNTATLRPQLNVTISTTP